VYEYCIALESNINNGSQTVGLLPNGTSLIGFAFDGITTRRATKVVSSTRAEGIDGYLDVQLCTTCRNINFHEELFQETGFKAFE
jgi:hypothetical protein